MSSPYSAKPPEGTTPLLKSFNASSIINSTTSAANESSVWPSKNLFGGYITTTTNSTDNSNSSLITGGVITALWLPTSLSSLYILVTFDQVIGPNASLLGRGFQVHKFDVTGPFTRPNPFVFSNASLVAAINSTVYPILPLKTSATVSTFISRICDLLLKKT